MAAASPKKTTARSRRRKRTSAQSAAVQWLRIGAVGFGLGAAVTVGQGVAAAAPDASSNPGTQASGGSATHGAAAKSARTGSKGPRRAQAAASPGDQASEGLTDRASAATQLTSSHLAPAALAPTRIATLLSSQAPALATQPTASGGADQVTSGEELDAVADPSGPVPTAAVDKAPTAINDGLQEVVNRADTEPSPTGLPLPASPVGELLGFASAGVREVEQTTAGKTAAAVVDSAEPQVVPARAARLTTAADTATPTETEREQSQADVNLSIGWIPGVGTVLNTLNLVTDFLDFTLAALRGDIADMGDEIGDMSLDVIGMIPIVGGPLAGTIHNLIAGASAPPNRAPVAVTDNFSVNQNTQLTGNVKANDTDPDGDALTVGVVSGPAHGNLSLNPDGSFTYSPAANFSGADAFTYAVSDGKGGQANGAANITVNAVTPPPSTPTLSQQVAAFVSATRGRTIANPDGSYAGECVSLVRQYLEQVFNIRTGAWGNAVDYRSGASGGNQLASRGFTWHTDRSFQDGDILVFGQSSQGGTSALGHIGIWSGGQFYDQNDGWRGDARTANYSPFDNTAPYTDRGVSAAFLGYWRAPGGSTGGGGGATSGTRSGTATVRILVNVRNDPSTNGPIVAQYSPGQTFNYDSWVIGNGYYWLSYVSYSGVRRYVAESTLDGSTVYVSGGVFH